MIPSSKKRASEVRTSFENLDQIRELPENSSSNRESSKKVDAKFENSQKISQSEVKIVKSKGKGIDKFNKHKQRQSNKRGSESVRDPTTRTRTSYLSNGYNCCGMGSRVSEPSKPPRVVEESRYDTH